MLNRRRARKIRNFAFVLFLASLAGGLFWGVFYSPLFLIEKVEILGLETVPSGGVIDVTDEWLSGQVYAVFPRRHILFYGPEFLSAEIFRNFPRIGDLKIRPDINKRSLMLVAEERSPQGILCDESDGRCYLFDKRGTLFEYLEKPGGSGGLLVRWDSGSKLALGDSALSSEWVDFLDTFRVHLQPELWVQEFVIEAESFAANYVRARTADGWDLLVNVEKEEPQFLSRSVKAFLALEIKDSVGRLSYIDMRVPGRAYYKLR